MLFVLCMLEKEFLLGNYLGQVLATYIVNSYALICIFYPDSSAYVYNFVSLRNYLGVCIYKVVMFWGFKKFNYAHIFHSASLSKCLLSVPMFFAE